MATYTPYEKNQSSFFRRLRNRRRKASNKGGGGTPQGPAFKITVDTTLAGSASNTFILPTTGAGYDALVDWGDSQSEQIIGTPGNVTHVYGAPGTYQISITGLFPRIFFNGGGDRRKLISIDNWGDIVWSSFTLAFFDCENLNGAYSDAPDLSAVTDISHMFNSCDSFNGDVNDFNLSNVQTIRGMFNNASSFNKPVNGWDTSSVTEMRDFVHLATSFKQSVGSWNIESCTNFVQFADFIDINETGTTTNYDETLNGWGAQNVVINRLTDFGTSKYSATGKVGHDILTGQGWTITDGGLV